MSRHLDNEKRFQQLLEKGRSFFLLFAFFVGKKLSWRALSSKTKLSASCRSSVENRDSDFTDADVARIERVAKKIAAAI